VYEHLNCYLDGLVIVVNVSKAFDIRRKLLIFRKRVLIWLDEFLKLLIVVG
jgi:hypothetical protein